MFLHVPIYCSLNSVPMLGLSPSQEFCCRFHQDAVLVDLPFNLIFMVLFCWASCWSFWLGSYLSETSFGAILILHLVSLLMFLFYLSVSLYAHVNWVFIFLGQFFFSCWVRSHFYGHVDWWFGWPASRHNKEDPVSQEFLTFCYLGSLWFKAFTTRVQWKVFMAILS